MLEKLSDKNNYTTIFKANKNNIIYMYINIINQDNVIMTP